MVTLDFSIRGNYAGSALHLFLEPKLPWILEYEVNILGVVPIKGLRFLLVVFDVAIDMFQTFAKTSVKLDSSLKPFMKS